MEHNQKFFSRVTTTFFLKKKNEKNFIKEERRHATQSQNLFVDG